MGLDDDPFQHALVEPRRAASHDRRERPAHHGHEVALQAGAQ